MIKRWKEKRSCDNISTVRDDVDRTKFMTGQSSVSQSIFIRFYRLHSHHKIFIHMLFINSHFQISIMKIVVCLCSKIYSKVCFRVTNNIPFPPNNHQRLTIWYDVCDGCIWFSLRHWISLSFTRILAKIEYPNRNNHFQVCQQPGGERERERCWNCSRKPKRNQNEKTNYYE